jgi:hypothetical protein
MNNKIPHSLLRAIKNKNLIPIVGAGVSMSLKRPNGEDIFPSWKRLLELAADKMESEGKEELAFALKAMLPIGRYKTAADFAREGLGGALWERFFRKLFAIEKSEIALDSMDLPKSIWKLSNRIISLNYDKVMRFSISDIEDVAEIDNFNSAELARFSRSEDSRKSIWHLHGRIDNIASIIFQTESYDELYLQKNSSQKAALSVLHSLCRDEVLCFVGCSLDDAELLAQFSENQKLFNGNVGPHFAIVKEADSQKIRQKLYQTNIEILTVPEFGPPLVDFIDFLSTGRLEAPSLSKPTPMARNSTSKVGAKIAVLSSQPINKTWNYDNFNREIKKLKGDFEYFFLNEYSLNNLHDFDYIIIFTHLIKGKIVIEDMHLNSQSISLCELEDLIGNNTTSGLFLFVETQDDFPLTPVDFGNVSSPLILVPNLDEDQISSVFFQIFRKWKLEYPSDAIISNKDQFERISFEGNYRETRRVTALPGEIDAKTTNQFVGRNTDVEVICKKILAMRDGGSILTIKGSGGIGKTVTVKKVTVELAKRGFFSAGISFIDCEVFTGSKAFENMVGVNLDLTSTHDVREQLKQINRKLDKLIILDNVETLLHHSETDQILSFISLLADYANILLTSREVLNLTSQDVYELRQLTTDEAMLLFEAGLPAGFRDDREKRFVRSEIVERLLDNNPLAIKLITANIPKGKSFHALKEELETDFFRKVSDAEIEVYDNLSDTNIERKKSLYASINFSYQRLNENEKIAFELLSLFPDGINIEHFKKLAEIKTDNQKTRRKSGRANNAFKITDPIIRALENKSIIQVNNHLIKLQSIVGKFSERRLSLRKPGEIQGFHRNALQYSLEFSSLLANVIHTKHALASRIMHSYQNNFLKSISFMEASGFSKSEFLIYFQDLGILFTGITASGNLARAMDSHESLFKENADEYLCYKVLKLNAEYYDGQFDKAFSEINRLIPLEITTSLDLTNEIVQLTVVTASEIYLMEGYALEALEIDIARKKLSRFYPISLFELGEHDRKLAETSLPNYFKLATLDALGILTLDMIDDYFASIYEKTHIERMQTSYLRCKHTRLSKKTIDQLTVVNEYTDGLKSLMYAMIESDYTKKEKFYERSIEKLAHIKYFQAEAIYLYCEHLNIISSQNFDFYLNLGSELSSRYNYRYMKYKFETLTAAVKVPYNSLNYRLARDVDIASYIANLLESRRRQ